MSKDMLNRRVKNGIPPRGRGSPFNESPRVSSLPPCKIQIVSEKSQVNPIHDLTNLSWEELISYKLDLKWELRRIKLESRRRLIKERRH